MFPPPHLLGSQKGTHLQLASSRLPTGGVNGTHTLNTQFCDAEESRNMEKFISGGGMGFRLKYMYMY